jgi:hypothetical protein
VRSVLGAIGGAGGSSPVVFAGAFGTWIGALVGVVAPKTADLVYRAPKREARR